MLWPQYVLTGYLTWLCAASICKYLLKTEGSTAKKLGGTIGYILRYGIIFSLLIAGGFYN